MSTMTIGQVAEKTGFSTSSLRYYEGIGLVVPAARSDAGYRLYDASTVGRMAFIARAKQLGCTLDEITDLVGVWQGDQCGPVQRRLHELVTTKIAETQERLDELTAFADQLRTAAAQLNTDPLDGPCDDGCACLAGAAPPDAPVAVTLGTKPGGAEVPIACTLSAGGVDQRAAEWRAALDHATERSTGADGAVLLVFDAGTPVDELLRLVAAEQQCCAFFSFVVGLDASGLRLEVRAPEEGRFMISTVFGEDG